MKSVRIRIVDILTFMLFFSLVKVYAIPQVMQQVVKIAFVIILLAFCFSKKSIINSKNPGIWLTIAYVIPSIVGYFINELSVKQAMDGILNAFCVFNIFSIIKYFSKRGKSKSVIKTLFICNIIACLISIISVLIQGRPSEYTGTEFEYFFGNKFNTSYLFIQLIGLYYVYDYSTKKKFVKRPTVLIGLIALEFFVSYWTRCSTTLLGGVVLILAIFVSGRNLRKIEAFFSAPIVALLSFLLPGLVVMNFSVILNIPFIQNLFINVLHKPVGLNGRAFIYRNIFSLISERPLIGYGYNSNIIEKGLHAILANAQNGLLQTLLSYGLIGTTVLSVIIYKAFKNCSDDPRFWGTKIVFYALCACSIVEISINYYFYLTLSLIYFAATYEQEYDSVTRRDYKTKISGYRLYEQK